MASRQTHERRRLQKCPRGSKFQKSLYSRKEILDVLRTQTCLATLTNYQDDPPMIEQAEHSTKTKPHVGFCLEDQNGDSSDDDTMSMYSAMETQDNPHRRLRSKTPVHFVGQLEKNSMARHSDRAQSLAEDYQSQLPPRAFTPFCEAEIPRHPPHKLRKIKCQLSLRDLVKEDRSKPRPRTSATYSDADTLVGSEPSTALTSPTSEKGRQRSLDESYPHVTHNYEEVVAEMDHNIGLKICADLLTNELVSALYRHHPAELDDRASGLQILLMIEAYEAVQQHVRQMLYDTNATGGNEKHVRMVDEILEHWLQVLYSVYDRSQEQSDVHRTSHDEFEGPRLMTLRSNGEG
jgi:hypothetical protein